MDLTPLVPVGRQVIERYGASGFRIAGVIWRGPVLVFPDLTVRWTGAAEAGVSEESLKPVVEHGGVEILLLGLGGRMSAVTRDLRAALRQAGIALEPMETGAACRTYNVLLSEDRRVAAALLPPV
jgi:uncharacterized protein